MHDGPVAHLIAAEDIAGDIAQIDHDHAARGQQQKIHVQRAALAVRHQHVAQVIEAAAGYREARAPRACAGADPSATAEQPAEQHRHDERRSGDETPDRWVAMARIGLQRAPQRVERWPRSRCMLEGRSNKRARFSGIGTLSPISGSTISRNFAGWAVATITQRRRRADRRRQPRVGFGGHRGVRTPDAADSARSRRGCARGSPSSSIDTALSAPRSAAASGYSARRRSRLLGSPTSIAEDSVATLGRVCATRPRSR